jgi:multidrug resistance protein, MATE family
MADPPATPDAAPVAARIRPFAVTHRSVVRIAVPMTLAYVSVPMVGVIDTAVIGQLGDAALLGGIAVGAIVLDIVFVAFNFLRSGTTGLTAQALGAGERTEMVAVLGRALIVAAVSGLLIVLLQWPLVEGGILVMDPGASVEGALREYLTIRIWASPFGLINYALLGWLLGLGRSLTALAIQTIFAGLNIVLSVWFVLGLGWSVAGVAWASVLAELLTVLLQVPLILKLAPRGTWPSRARIFDRRGFSRLLGVNRDIMIRSFTLLFAFAFFTRQGARFGEVTLAANAVLMHFFVVGGYFLDGFATAAEQLAGRAVGARFRPAFQRVVRLTTIWGVATGAVLSALYLLLGPSIVDLMTTSPEVRAAARHYLLWAALTPLAGAIAFQMDGIFIGATWSRDMRNMMLLSVLIYLGACFALTPLWGNHGLWAALLIFLGARSFTFHWRMRHLLPRTFPA